MKKKLYIQPNLVVVSMGMRKMVCASIREESNNLKVTFDSEEFGDGEVIN